MIDTAADTLCLATSSIVSLNEVNRYVTYSYPTGIQNKKQYKFIQKKK